MTKPVGCRIVDMPDGRFAVVAVLASGKVFRHTGLATPAEAEESAEVLRAVMDACGAPLITPAPEPPALENARFFGSFAIPQRPAPLTYPVNPKSMTMRMRSHSCPVLFSHHLSHS